VDADSIGDGSLWEPLHVTDRRLYVWLALVFAAAAVLPHDAALSALMRVPYKGGLGRLARMLSWAGETWVLIWLGLLPLVLIGSGRLTLRTLLGLIAVLVLVQLIKGSVHRVRPVPTGADSFPSGHTAAFALLAALWASRWPGRPRWLYGVVVLMGLSRIAMGRHFVSDVLGGALVGLAAARLVMWPRAIPLEALAVRLRGTAIVLMGATLIFFAAFDSGGEGKWARLFGPALLVLLVWTWLKIHPQLAQRLLPVDKAAATS
jgi:undecaprenyl-diphosphatase